MGTVYRRFVVSKGLKLQLFFSDAAEMEQEFNRISEKIAKPTKLLDRWRTTVLSTLEQRFNRQMGPDGPWKRLSPLSTEWLRGRKDLTRIKPRRLGGRPVKPLISRYRKYMRAWSDKTKGVQLRTEKTFVGNDNAYWRIINRHPAVLNENRRTSAGIIGGKIIPKRSVAYIREDERLQSRLVENFIDFVFEGK